MNTTAERIVRMVWKGPISRFLRDPTPEIDLEGALSSGKTTACLWKVRTSTIEHPGIDWFIGRYGDGETQTKLKPAFEDVCRLSGEVPTWDSKSLAYRFQNGSRVFSFGLKAPDHLSRYAKVRGLGVAGIYVDQTEEVPGDMGLELRARLRQPGFPHQLIFSPNPPNVDHWLAKEFPDVGCAPGRAYYSVSLYDNAHNLPAELIASLELAYPVGHAKHRSVILGKRGLNVTGEPVYQGAFSRRLHVRPLAYEPSRVLLEALDFGKHHPCWLAAQQTASGGMLCLGGLMGQDLFLDEFLPLVDLYRGRWFDPISGIQTCCDPAGAHDNSQGTRQNGVTLLREASFHPVWKPNSNAPDVRGTVIERLAGHMRHRGSQGELFGIDAQPQRWLRLTKDGPEPWDFLADGCEAGYVWDEHMVSVGNKQVRKPKKDGWFEHGQNCLEYLELNFGAGKDTDEQREKRRRAQGRVWQPVAQGPLGWSS